MKKRLLIPLVVFLVVAVVGIVASYWPRTVPWDECSELYRRYADSPDIRAAYIKDYRVNDSLTINATILEATTDSSWRSLLVTFHDTITDAAMEPLKRGLDVLSILSSDRRPDSIMTNDEFAVLSRCDRYICVFHIQDSVQREKVLDGIIDKVIFSIKNKQNFKNNQ